MLQLNLLGFVLGFECGTWRLCCCCCGVRAAPATAGADITRRAALDKVDGLSADTLYIIIECDGNTLLLVVSAAGAA